MGRILHSEQTYVRIVRPRWTARDRSLYTKCPMLCSPGAQPTGSRLTIDRDTFRAALGQWPSGVTVVTTLAEGQPHGMTASSFSSVSLDPPLVSICVGHGVASHDRIAASGHFAVSILAKDGIEHGMRFAGMVDVEDRFAGVDTMTATTGAPVLADALAWLDCKVWAEHDGGDHTIFVGEVLAAGVAPGRAPLLYHDRAWGQFADVLPEVVALDAVGTPDGGAVIDDVFGTTTAPDVDTIVARVLSTLAGRPSVVVLDDRAATATPLLLRSTLQSLSGRLGGVPITLRLGDSPLASANLLTALKSGVRSFQVGAPWIDRATASLLVDSLDIVTSTDDPGKPS